MKIETQAKLVESIVRILKKKFNNLSVEEVIKLAHEIIIEVAHILPHTEE